MQIFYHMRFLKQMEKLQKYQKIIVADAIDLFRKDPFNSSLKNHPLKGSAKGARAISAGFDLRIIFEEYTNDTVVLMLAVGSHEEVY